MSTTPVAVTFIMHVQLYTKTFPFGDVNTTDKDTTILTNGYENYEGAFYTEHSEESSTNFSQYDCFHHKGLAFISLNARSLLSKLRKLKLLANISKAIINGICETLLEQQWK